MFQAAVNLDPHSYMYDASLVLKMTDNDNIESYFDKTLAVLKRVLLFLCLLKMTVVMLK